MSSPDRALTGRLVFRQAGAPRALANVSFDATLVIPLFPDRSLGGGRVGPDGRFRVDLGDCGDTPTVRLALRVPTRTYGADGGAIDGWEHARDVDVEVPAGGDAGDVAVPWWPYRTDFPTPRVAAVNGKLPQHYTRGYAATLALAVAKGAPAQALLRGMNLLDSARPSMATIQSHQPKTQTIRVEAEHPGRTRSDAWLGDQLLNGFDITMMVGRDGDEPSRMRATITWGDMPCTKDFDLTDVDVVLEDRGADVVATRITLRIREPGEGGAWRSDTTRTFTPADGRDWERAKRVVRCQYLLRGALDGHITRAHFTTEMYTVAAMRNLHTNPVRHVLFPHMQEIVAQDHDGDSFAWGPHGILANQSALTMPVMHARMIRNTMAWDWTTFRPRTSVHATHRYAQAANLYWTVLTEHLTAFFDVHRDSIAAHWSEIRAFSDDLVAHSLAFEPAVDDPRVVPFDRNELDDPALPRATVGGVVRALRPVTTSDTPAPGEMDALLQLCRYMVFHATFNHSWTHDGQYDAGGELAYATFGLRNGSLGDEDDAQVAPPPLANIEGISTNTIGTRANYGYILADEEHDVPPTLKSALRRHARAFSDIGVDPEKIRSRINI